MAYLVDIQTKFPAHYYKQEDLIQEMLKIWSGKIKNLQRVEKIHQNVLVEGRHLALPLEDYFRPMSFGERNQHFITQAMELITGATQDILKKYSLRPSDISALWSNTVTGFAIPSLEARLMNRVAFRPQTKRVPLMGLGCMAGVAGINRVSDYLKAHPTEAVLFLSVELCSLTAQLENFSVANLISTGLFGDGAAVALMVGDQHPLREKAPLKWLASESIFFPNSEEVMGWDVSEQGLSIILNKNVPQVTEEQLPGPLDAFLARHELELPDFPTFLAHPGGPKVLMAMEKVLDLPQFGLKDSWESLAQNGNMSSVSVLDIFKRQMDRYRGELRGRPALSLAMGPAFSAELGLWRWN